MDWKVSGVKSECEMSIKSRLISIKSSLVRKRFEFQAEKTDSKKRLEDFLFERFENLSKMYLRDAVKSELCEVNGRFENRGYRLRANDFVEVEVDPARETAMRPQDIALDIVYEDESLAVINKPSGMLVHPTHAEKNGTMLNALAHHMNRGKGDKAFIRPGLIHRLDRHTSGLIVVAKTPRAHRVLAGHFQRKLVDKRYLAVVDGVVEADAGTIDAPIGRFAERKYWDVNEDGKHAETRFRVIERCRFGDAARAGAGDGKDQPAADTLRAYRSPDHRAMCSAGEASFPGCACMHGGWRFGTRTGAGGSNSRRRYRRKCGAIFEKCLCVSIKKLFLKTSFHNLL